MRTKNHIKSNFNNLNENYEKMHIEYLSFKTIFVKELRNLKFDLNEMTKQRNLLRDNLLEFKEFFEKLYMYVIKSIFLYINFDSLFNIIMVQYIIVLLLSLLKFSLSQISIISPKELKDKLPSTFKLTSDLMVGSYSNFGSIPYGTELV